MKMRTLVIVPRRLQSNWFLLLTVLTTTVCLGSYLSGNDGPVCCLVQARGWSRAQEYGPKLSVKQQNARCSSSLRQHQPLAFSSAGHMRENAFGAPDGGCKRGAAITSITLNTPCVRTPTSGCTRSRASVSVRACTAQPFRAEAWRNPGRPITSVAFHIRREKPSVLILQKGAGQGGCLFAASGNALRIPLSSKQLKIREQAQEQLERETAKASDPARREQLQDKESPEDRRKRLKAWRVVLHNDDIHTFEFVENAIIDILPHITRARAYDIALHAHTNRQATILLTWEENAREVALALQEEGLTVSIFPNKIFNEEA